MATTRLAVDDFNLTWKRHSAEGQDLEKLAGLLKTTTKKRINRGLSPIVPILINSVYVPRFCIEYRYERKGLH